MTKLFHLGATDPEIAAEYDVTPQAVNKRMIALGLRREPVIKQVRDLINSAWPVKVTRGPDSHHNRRPMAALRLYIRQQLGDDLSEAQVKRVDALVKKLLAEHLVLDYDVDSHEGVFYAHRRREDGRRIMRWPSDVELPSADLLKALDLPEVGPEGSEG
ncbi:hypothetical protein [Streptomyces sp. NPDC087862]|uniref:hypothetical protein n=1 Tax=Streptomyces sp. NPDC087862 TaxID=3365813 RepID=UPI0037F91A26